MLSGEYFGLTTEHAPREDSKSAFGVPPPRSVAGEISAAALRTTAFARAPRRRFPLARRFALFESANDVLNFPLKSSSSKTFLFLLFVKEEREEEEAQKQLVKVLVVVVVILSFFLSLSVRYTTTTTHKSARVKQIARKKRLSRGSV
jgi:hypothetical protein